MSEDDFADLKELTNSPGWTKLIEEIKEELEQLKEGFQYTEDNNKFHFNRGRCSVLNRLLSLENTIDFQREQMNADI